MIKTPQRTLASSDRWSYYRANDSTIIVPTPLRPMMATPMPCSLCNSTYQQRQELAGLHFAYLNPMENTTLVVGNQEAVWIVPVARLSGVYKRNLGRAYGHFHSRHQPKRILQIPHTGL